MPLGVTLKAIGINFSSVECFVLKYPEIFSGINVAITRKNSELSVTLRFQRSKGKHWSFWLIDQTQVEASVVKAW